MSSTKDEADAPPSPPTTLLTKWFSVEPDSGERSGKATLQISATATAVLEAEAGPVNCVSVFGEVRTGKSYLLNALCRTTDCFGVDHNIHSFTTGVDICTKLFPLAEMMTEPMSDCPSLGGPKLLFCDCEGQGNRNESFDLKLITPVLLVSKIVIMNVLCGAGPPREKILTRLQLVVHAAKQVARSERAAVFGHLHLVLRDCRGDPKECDALLFGVEDSESAASDEEEEAMKRRNGIRADLRKAFESPPTVWCTPRVLDAPPNYIDADPSYVAAIDAMRACMVAQLREPKRFDSVPLTGVAIAELMPAVREALLSDNPAFNPPSAMEAICNAMVRRASAGARKEVDAMVTELRAALPQVVAELEATLAARADAVMLTLDAELDAVPRREEAEVSTRGAEEREMVSTLLADSRVTINSENLSALRADADQAEACTGEAVEAALDALRATLPLSDDDLKTGLGVIEATALSAFDGSIVIASGDAMTRARATCESVTSDKCKLLCAENEAKLQVDADQAETQACEAVEDALDALRATLPLSEADLQEGLDAAETTALSTFDASIVVASGDAMTRARATCERVATDKCKLLRAGNEIKLKEDADQAAVRSGEAVVAALAALHATLPLGEDDLQVGLDEVKVTALSAFDTTIVVASGGAMMRARATCERVAREGAGVVQLMADNRAAVDEHVAAAEAAASAAADIALTMLRNQPPSLAMDLAARLEALRTDALTDLTARLALQSSGEPTPVGSDAAMARFTRRLTSETENIEARNDLRCRESAEQAEGQLEKAIDAMLIGLRATLPLGADELRAAVTEMRVTILKSFDAAIICESIASERAREATSVRVDEAEAELVRSNGELVRLAATKIADGLADEEEKAMARVKAQLSMPPVAELIFEDLSMRRGRQKAALATTRKTLLAALATKLEEAVPIEALAAEIRATVTKRVTRAGDALEKEIDATFVASKTAKRTARMYVFAAAALAACVVLQYLKGLVFG